jgi:HEAT repeat protein
VNSWFPHTLLDGAFVVGTLVTLIVAAAVLHWHYWNKRCVAEVDRKASALALEFARFLQNDARRGELRTHAAAASREVLWGALDAFSNNIEGEEWRVLSRELADLPGVTREIGMLGHRAAWRRALAARHLGLIHAYDSIPRLRHAMEGGPTSVTLAAALALARLEHLPALEWLLEHSTATSDCGRYQLVALLKRFGTGGNTALRHALFAETIETPIQLAAIELLGLRRDLHARRRLEDLLLAESVETRIAVTRALGRIGAARSLPALQDALGDPAWQVRAQASRALGELNVKFSAPRLAPLLRDPSWWVRRNSAYALADLGRAGRATLARLAREDTDPFARDMAREVLQALDWEAESPGGITRVA